MAIDKKKALFIGLGVTGAVLVILGIVGGVGYSKAGSFIKSFEEDYKKVTGGGDCKKASDSLKGASLSDFMSTKDSKTYQIAETSVSSGYNKDEVKKALDDKSKDKLESFTDFSRTDGDDIDASKFEKVVGEIGFMVKIGFWFKGKHPVKKIREMSSLIHKTIKDSPKGNEKLFAVLNIVGDKEVKLYDVKVAEDQKVSNIGSAQVFKFEDSGDFKVSSSEIISFMVEKVKKTASS